MKITFVVFNKVYYIVLKHIGHKSDLKPSINKCIVGVNVNCEV